MATLSIPHQSVAALQDPSKLLENFKAIVDRINDGSVLLGATSVSIVFSTTPNTTSLVPHTLGRIPVNWIILGVDKQANIFEINKSSWTTTEVQFRVSAVGLTATTQEIVTAKILLL